MSKVIGVDLGGTNLRTALISNHRILKYIKKRTPKNKDELLRELVDSVSQFMSEDIKGIGVASPGPLENGVIKNTPNLPIKYFNLKGFLENKLKKRVVVQNDAKCVALAESRLGCKKKNFFILTLGTGIGGGIIINRKLYVGKGYAGELGHIILNNEKDFEHWWKFYRALGIEYFKKEMLVKELLKMRDKRAYEVLHGASNIVAQGITSLANIFDPEVIILAGGVRESGASFLNMIKKDVKKHLFIPRKLDIRWTKLEHPGVLGASLLID